MAEPQDAGLPILKNIQTNLTRLESKVDNQGGTLLDFSEKMEAIQGLMTFHLGMTTEQQHQLTTIQKEVKELQIRVFALEHAES